MGPTRRTPVGFYRAWDPADDWRAAGSDLSHHEAVTEVLQRKAVRRSRASRAWNLAGQLLEGPLGGVLFVVLLGVSLVVWGAGLGW